MNPTREVQCAGRLHRRQTQPVRLEAGGPVTVRGAGHSFSDAALGARTLFCCDDPALRTLGPLGADGTVEAGAGVSIRSLAAWLAARGRALPVVGGTRHATIGGAIAADVHGKNDHHDGSFGNHTIALELELADGSRRWCSRSHHPDSFAATVGGMGLTGRIRRARLSTEPRQSWAARWTGRRFTGIPALMAAFAAAPSDARWTAAWVDLAQDPLRGILHTVRPAPATLLTEPRPTHPRALPLPGLPLLNPTTAALAGRLIWRLSDLRPRTIHLWDHLWSTDRVAGWNRLYGRRGAEEFQFAAGPDRFATALERILRIGAETGVRPCFAMIKRLGSHPRAGLLSFPATGFTLTANHRHHPSNPAVFRRFIDEAVVPAEGRLYLTKDSAMTAEQARRCLPGLARWQEVVTRLDPGGRFRSDLSERLALKP